MKKILLTYLLLVSLGSVQTFAKDWYYGAGLVYGQNFTDACDGLTHKRVDLYVVNKNYPSFTAKIGYAKQQNLTTSLREDYPNSVIYEPESDALLFGIGYNIVTYESFFLDVGFVYNYIISETNHDGAITARWNDGSYQKAEKLRFNSAPGFELGFGYSFDDFSIRTDMTMVFDAFEITEQSYDVDDQPNGQVFEDGYASAYITIGVVYWF